MEENIVSLEEQMRDVILMKEIKAKVFYTPVQSPEEVRCIEVTSDDTLTIINNFVKRIVARKLKIPSTIEPNFSEKTLIKFLKYDSEVNSEEIKNLFEVLSRYMYGKARAPQKYWCLIRTEEYSFIYHFTPEKAVSFEEDNIKEFIKYLDNTNLLKFIFKLRGNKVSSYFDKLSEEVLAGIQGKASDVYGIFDKSGTKGMKKLTGEEPEYEFRGKLRVRIKRTDKTDIVVETFLDDLKNINSNVNLKFEEQLATINIDKAPITELVVDGVKYDVKTGVKRIRYETLGIGEFIEKFKFYENDEKLRETKEDVTIGSKRINKPESNFDGKEETIFILGKTLKDQEILVNEIFEAIRNNFNVAFVELSNFKGSYDNVNIGYFSVFAKLNEDEKLREVEETFKTFIQNVKGNLTLERTIHYVGLLVLCKFIKSKGFREKIYYAAKKALNAYYKNMSRNVELKELNRIGIEFKAGIINGSKNNSENEKGFFVSSPKKFSKKLSDKFKRKKKDIVIFFVGINEDTRDFNPIPLNRIRNEFHDDLVRYLKESEVNLLLSETIPISEKEGILLLVLQRKC